MPSLVEELGLGFNLYSAILYPALSLYDGSGNFIEGEEGRAIVIPGFAGVLPDAQGVVNRISRLVPGVPVSIITAGVVAAMDGEKL